MPPKKIRRITTPIASEDATDSFVAIINGKPSFVKLNSGIDDESVMTGQVDVEALREAGLTDDEIAAAQDDLNERIDNELFGTSLKANTIKA